MNWTAEDVEIAVLLDGLVGPVQVLEMIEHKENDMSDQAPEDFTGGSDDAGWGEATGKPVLTGNPAVTYPEYPYSLADHVYTWSPKLPDGSMLVIRSQSADGLVAAVEAVAPLAGRLRSAWQAVTGQPVAAAPAPAPQGQPNYNPVMPPPNQPFPGQPAWQQAGAAAAPPQQQWAAPLAPTANVPQGWYRLDVPFKPRGSNPGKPGFDAIVAQYSFRKGDPSQGGQVSFQKEVKSWFCSPEIAQAFAVFNPVVAQ